MSDLGPRPHRPAPDRGLIDGPLAGLAATEFFSWFCFEPVENDTVSTRDDGRRVDLFRPEGPRFRDEVLLRVVLWRELIENLDLSLEPAMFERGNHPFALDCIKSFLSAVAPATGNGGDALRALASCVEVVMAGDSITFPRDPLHTPLRISEPVRNAAGVLEGYNDRALLGGDGIVVAIMASLRAGGAGGRAINVSVRRHPPRAEFAPREPSTSGS